jgi:hypothetical protein
LAAPFRWARAVRVCAWGSVHVLPKYDMLCVSCYVGLSRAACDVPVGPTPPSPHRGHPVRVRVVLAVVDSVLIECNAGWQSDLVSGNLQQRAWC